MSEVNFSRSRAYVCTAVAFAVVLTLPGALLACWDVIFRGSDRQILKYDTFGTAVFIGALFLSLCALLLWELSNLTSVRLSEQGVRQRGLTGWKFIAWEDVTHLGQSDHWLHIHAGRRKVIIPLLAYSDRREVIRFIAGRLAEHHAPRPGGDDAGRAGEPAARMKG